MNAKSPWCVSRKQHSQQRKIITSDKSYIPCTMILKVTSTSITCDSAWHTLSYFIANLTPSQNMTFALFVGMKELFETSKLVTCNLVGNVEFEFFVVLHGLNKHSLMFYQLGDDELHINHSVSFHLYLDFFWSHIHYLPL